jgi:hypothetical protein
MKLTSHVYLVTKSTKTASPLRHPHTSMSWHSRSNLQWLIFGQFASSYFYYASSLCWKQVKEICEITLLSVCLPVCVSVRVCPSVCLFPPLIFVRILVRSSRCLCLNVPLNFLGLWGLWYSLDACVSVCPLPPVFLYFYAFCVTSK